MADKPRYRVRYCLIDSETGLTIHNFFSEEKAREATVRMTGSYHIAQEVLDENNMPVEGEVFTDADGSQYECMDCEYIGSDWYEIDTIKDIVEQEAVDANMMLCPKCHSEHYYTYGGE